MGQGRYSMTQTITWTVAAYYQALKAGQLNDEKQYEILDGELVEMTSPILIHQAIGLTLAFLLKSFAKDKNLGHVMVAPMDVILSNENKPQPDVIFVSKSRFNILKKRGRVRGTPDLLVEISSPSTGGTDRVRKRRTYEEAGVLEYWLIDAESETAQVLKLENGQYVEVAQAAGRLASAVVLPGFSVALAELFELPEGIEDGTDEDEVEE